MDLETVFEFMHDKDGNDTKSNDVIDEDVDFLESYTEVAIPYLVVISLATIFGTFGNILIISAVLVEKVCIHVHVQVQYTDYAWNFSHEKLYSTVHECTYYISFMLKVSQD